MKYDPFDEIYQEFLRSQAELDRKYFRLILIVGIVAVLLMLGHCITHTP